MEERGNFFCRNGDYLAAKSPMKYSIPVQAFNFLGPRDRISVDGDNTFHGEVDDKEVLPTYEIMSV